MAQLSFSKVTTVSSTDLITGRIYFETSTGCIKVAKSATEVDVFGAGVKSASWDEVSLKLTIVNQDNKRIEVDFSDVASASSVTSQLATKLNIGSDSDASTVQSYHGLKKYVDEQVGEIPAAIVYKGDGTTITQSGSSEVTFAVGTIGQDKVSGLSDALAGKANTTHTHTKSQITDFDESDYATAAQGTKADTALQTISASGEGNLTLTAAAKSGTTQAISGKLTTSTVSSNGSGLVIASDVKSYVDSAVNTSLSSVLKYKGSCAYAELPEEPAEGDVWNVTDAHDNVPAGTNYAWNGESWDALAGSVDLSPYLTIASAASTYATQSALTSGLAGKANTSHTHEIADVTNLQTALDEKVPTTRTVNGKALSDNVVVGGEDIVVGGEGAHAAETVQEAIDAIEASLEGKVDTNTTYTFANGTDGSFTVTPSTGGAQKVTIGKPSTAGTADKVGHGITVSLNGTAQTKFDGSADVAFNITAVSIGAAAVTHTHQYAGSASAGGPANSVANALTIQLNGSAQPTYNGAAARTINITPSSIGAYTKAEVDAKWEWAEFE